MTGIMAITAKIPMKIGDSDQSHIYVGSFAVSSFPSVLLFVSSCVSFGRLSLAFVHISLFLQIV
jgi:hypothetical protein